MTRARKSALLGILGAVAASALAAANPQQPYAGLDRRAIKALSPSDIDDLWGGRGAGMALPAELNGYPGPKHVLELAATLDLTPEQRRAAQAVFDEMQARAGALGREVLREEAALEKLFASGKANDASLRAATGEAARLRGELRFLHLRYHLAMRDLLNQEQLARYRQARGYGGAPAQQPGHRQH